MIIPVPLTAILILVPAIYALGYCSGCLREGRFWAEHRRTHNAVFHPKRARDMKHDELNRINKIVRPKRSPDHD